MMTADVVGAKALTTPTVCYRPDFLDHFFEPTLEMVDWYYRTPFVDTIQMREVDEHTLVIEVVEISGNKRVNRSFTIGRSMKTLICRNYLYYHPMKIGGDTRP